MKFAEVKLILKRLYKEHVKKHINRILIALVLSIVVAASTSGIAWLLDPAVKKIFIEQDRTFAWSIPLLIIIAFSSKGLSLYFARINIIRVGEEVAGELQKKIANNILLSDIQTLENRHSGKYISNIMFDTHHVQNLVSSGVLNLMKDSFSVIALVSLMFYQNWKCDDKGNTNNGVINWVDDCRFYFFSGKLISSGELEVNNFFSFLAAMMLAYQPIRSLATINMIAYQGSAAFKRISDVIDKEIQIFNNEKSPDIIIKNSDIEFKNVGFKYDTTDKRAIKNINLNIKGNTMTAFVGHSGAGKSTIISLLPRFYDPQEGSIKIDNQNINDISLKSLRKNLSMVSQDIILFDDTIRNNISYARDDASEAEIKEACKFAAADEFIEKLPNKYDTLIGENGVRLSGGQKQRLSIARAILKESPIILLDEATSSLDAESEEVVQNAILNLTKNKTTLVIAHRLSTIHNADKIFVLKNGTIIDTGKHEYLIKSCDEYKSLYEKQLK